jgi:enoyl-CoA hydratase/carnithine racemase
MDNKEILMTATDAILLRHDQDGICTLTLNRPQARNALSRALMAAVQEQMDALRDDASVKVVVIAANGPAFCAGHDLKEVSNLQGEEHLALFQQCSAMMMSVVRLPKPVIARVHAMATAAGCQLVASCDLAYAAEDAKFATPGVNIGLFCSTPMVALSRNVPRKVAMEMLLSGKPISADRAAAFGLVNEAVSADALDSAVYDMAKTIAAKSPLTLAIGKEAFYQQLEMGQSDAYDFASAVMARNMAARDAQEGIEAFLAKRPAVWSGC